METAILIHELCWITKNYTTLSEIIWRAPTDDSRLSWKWSQYHYSHQQTKKYEKSTFNPSPSYVYYSVSYVYPRIFNIIFKQQKCLKPYTNIPTLQDTTRYLYCQLNFPLIVILRITELWILLDKTAAIRASFQCHHALHNKIYCLQTSY